MPGAQALAGAEGADVSLAFSEEDRPGYFAAVDGHRALAEVGWLRFPKLMHMGWAAQWLLYEADLRANLSRPALVVPVFEDQVGTNAPDVRGLLQWNLAGNLPRFACHQGKAIPLYWSSLD